MSRFLKDIKAAVKPAYQAALNLLPCRAHVQLDYFRVYRRLPNLENPRSFSEKIASRKLYDRDARLPQLVDKIRVKEIIAEKYGPQYVLPTLAVYNSVDELDFCKEPLSNPPYVLKANHASGTNIFVRNKEDLRPVKIRERAEKFMKIDWYEVAREWAYSRVTPRIFVEPYIETPGGFLPDIKLHMFQSKAYAIEAWITTMTEDSAAFFTPTWELMDLGFEPSRYPRYKGTVPRPPQLEEMIAFAEKISDGFSYMRVDFYVVEGQIKVGELTFYPGAGHDRFDNDSWDMEFGRQWNIDWKRGHNG